MSSEDIGQRLALLETHVVNIKDKQENYEVALKELAENMNKLALAMAEREQDREKLREVAIKIDKLQEAFSAYKEDQLLKEVNSSRKWIFGSLQWVAGIIAALIIFHFTKDVRLVGK